MSHPPVSQQITFLYTLDLGVTGHFYEEVVGLQLKADQGACRIYHLSGDGYIGFCQRDDVPSAEENRQRRNVIFTIVTDEVNAWYEYLQANGAEIEKAPVTNSRYNIYHFFITDPNGYLIEFQRFLDPDWKPASS
jgi:catechol 2,3-dioxygenase-like lactoylglutathione lyase family enzyme